MPQITIMTRAYRPFVMGGSVRYNVKTTVEGDGPHDIGRGYQGYVIKTPKGGTRVAEATTGALIAPSLKEVREDIKQGDPVIMEKQIKEAAQAAKNANMLTPEEFWVLYER